MARYRRSAPSPARLQELAERLKEQPITEAALLIVGKVVNFREHLRWFDSRALFGRRALVMDSSDEPGDIADLLRAHGAEVVSDTDADVDVYRQLLDRKIDLVTFTSASAVLNFAATTAQTRRRICSVIPWSPRWAPRPPTPPTGRTSRRPFNCRKVR